MYITPFQYNVEYVPHVLGDMAKPRDTINRTSSCMQVLIIILLKITLDNLSFKVPYCLDAAHIGICLTVLNKCYHKADALQFSLFAMLSLCRSRPVMTLLDIRTLFTYMLG